MGDASEVVREVGVNDFRVATEQQPFHLDHRLLGISPATVGVLFWWKIGFKDRFQHQHCCCHADSIAQGRDAQRPEFAVGLRYVHSSDRVRSVGFLPERKRQFAEPLLCAIRLDVRKVLGVLLRSFTPAVSASPKAPSGRPAHCPFRGLLGVHLRYGLHTRAATVFRDTLSEGFSHFVTSMTAPVASGWSSCRVGFSPTGKRRLYTAHGHSGHWSARALNGSVANDPMDITRAPLALTESHRDHVCSAIGTRETRSRVVVAERLFRRILGTQILQDRSISEPSKRRGNKDE